MGICGSSCCGGTILHFQGWTGCQAHSNDDTGKSRDGLYEPVLAESEREAVADLLQYLENVRILGRRLSVIMANENSARRDRFLLWGALTSTEHSSVF
jgi:hypothetical protein